MEQNRYSFDQLRAMPEAGRWVLYLSTLKKLADAGVLPPPPESIRKLVYGEAGEAAEVIDENTKLEIAMALADSWKDKGLRLKEGSEGEFLAYHKKQDGDQIVTEVVTHPSGEAAIMVMHLSGYDDKYLPAVNHAVIYWDSGRETVVKGQKQKGQWVVETYMGIMKLGALEEYFKENPGPLIEGAIAVLARVPPGEVKAFGRLDKAVEEAKHFASLGVLVTSHKPPITPEAVYRYNEIPGEVKTRFSQEEVLAEAERMVNESLPSLIDLWRILAEKSAN